MLDLTTAKRAAEPHQHLPEPVRTTCQRFAFGGVAFEILADEGVQWNLPADYQKRLGDLRNVAAVADVICAVSVDRQLPQPLEGPQPYDAVVRQSTAHGLRVLSSEMRAEVSCLAAGKYAATVRISASSAGCAALLTGLANAIVELEGARARADRSLRAST